MNEENNSIKMEKLFLALSDKTRLRILNLLYEREISVHYFAEILGESQPKISRHLAYLRSSGVVSARREGKWIYYRVNIPENKFASSILQRTLEWAEAQKDMKQDYERFSEIFNLNNSETKLIRSSEKDIYEKANTKKEGEELEVFLL